jgi:hypothetical protein
MTRERDDFDGIDISGPWGGIRVGSGIRSGGWDDDWGDDDADVRRIRRRVRHRLDFYKNFVFFAVITGALALLDWATGGDFWVQWLAIIWGGILLMQFFGTFVAPAVWGREAEERMVRREIERKRGRVHVANPSDRPRAE